MHNILNLKNVSRIYHKNINPVNALEDVSLSVPKGQFVSIVGRSGSGKSTLLNIVGGLDQMSGGEMFINHENMSCKRKRDWDLYRRFTVGMIFQSFNLIAHKSALQNVELALLFGQKPIHQRKKISARLLADLGLQDRMHHNPPELSGGEQQRVAIARAMANHPQILLADEPTGNLDSSTSSSILDLLCRINRDQQMTILMVTHDEALASQVSHRMVRLLDGRIVEDWKIRGQESGGRD